MHLNGEVKLLGIRGSSLKTIIKLASILATVTNIKIAKTKAGFLAFEAIDT